MWEITAVCSDPACDEEVLLWVREIDEVDREVCACGCCLVTLRVASFEPLVAAGR